MSRLLTFLLLWAFTTTAVGATAPDPLFASDELLEITINAPFELIDDERDKEKKYDGIVSYLDGAGESINLDVELEVRGNWRLNKRNCSYSQLWLDFKRGQVAGTLFENQNRLKLVVQCKRQDRYADYIIKEWQAYQLFSTLSDISLDTRLMNVTYIDSDDPDESRTHRAFFIEHQNRLAERFGFDEVELNRVPRGELNQHQSTLVSLFMYLLGNTDFSLVQAAEGDECCHNAKLLTNDAGEYIAIPYDFDASGFVDASYAPVPNPDFGINSNRSRVYRGYCVEEQILNAAIAGFQNSREQISAIVSDTTYVNSRSANRTTGYVEDFFEVLDNPRRIEREFVRDCRG